MGRPIYRIMLGTRMTFNKHMGSISDLAKIENAEIYWRNGTMVVIASQEWCDYLHGKTDVRPEPDNDDTPFEFDEQAFMRFIGQEVRR